MHMLLLLIRNEAIYNRIVQNTDTHHIAPFMTDMATFQSWIADNQSPSAALLDLQWPRIREAEQVLRRLGVTVTEFTGQFAQAETWLNQNILPDDDTVYTQLPLVEESDQAIEDSPESLLPVSKRVLDLHENPLLKRSKFVPVPNMTSKQEDILKPAQPMPTVVSEYHIEESVSVTPPQIIERIIEREVEKPVYIREERPLTLRSHLILVTGVWPRAGVSMISQILARAFSKRLPVGSVSLIEHPDQSPRMWSYFKADEHVKRYRHWLDEDTGQVIDIHGVSLVPLPPNHQKNRGSEERLVEYVYRQMRRPITIVDCALATQNELLFSMADHIVCVLDCDPTFLAVEELGTTYKYLLQTYPKQVTTVLNKWTKYANYKDPSSGVKYFADGIKVPYLQAEFVQRALWSGSFIEETEFQEELTPLIQRLVTPFVPEMFVDSKKASKFSFFRKGKSE